MRLGPTRLLILLPALLLGCPSELPCEELDEAACVADARCAPEYLESCGCSCDEEGCGAGCCTFSSCGEAE